MKQPIRFIPSDLRLFVPLTLGAGSAQDILPYPSQNHTELELDGEHPDDRLGGYTDVILFETEEEMNAFAAGFDFAALDDDHSWQRYELASPVTGYRFALITHNSDGDIDLNVYKFSTAEKN